MNVTHLDAPLPNHLSEEDAKLLLAIELYELEKVSVGQAAKIAGYSEKAFLETLGHYRIPSIRYSAADLREELGLCGFNSTTTDLSASSRI